MKLFCKLKKCGRVLYARGYCQTHHRQFLDTGKVHAIRPYQKRRQHTLKFAGLRFMPEVVKALRAQAKRNGLSEAACVVGIVEDWMARVSR